MKNPFSFTGITELEAAIETIKLWEYLAQNADNTKAEYFAGVPAEKIPLSGCHYCEFYLNQSKTYPGEDTKDKCKRKGCPLTANKLCNFAERGSAFEIWINLRNKGDKASARKRVQCAKQILKAAKKHYKKLTGEVYHEK